MNYFDKLSVRAEHLREKYSNRPRKAAASMVVWAVKNMFPKEDKAAFTDNALHIAVGVFGGLGDMVFAARYVNGLSRYLNLKVDVFTKEKLSDHAVALFEKAECVSKIVAEEDAAGDVVIRLVRFPQIVFCDNKRVQKVGDEKAKAYIRYLTDFQRSNPFVFKNDYFGRCFAKAKGKKREDQADVDDVLNLGDFRLNVGIAAPQIQGPFITFQTGGGSHFKMINRETRQWETEKYGRLAELLKREYPQFKIVQIGAEYHPLIKGVDVDLRGKTSDAEVFGLLSSAALHVQQEGGLAIVRHYLCRKPSVVLFGPTDEDFFGFSENLNIRADAKGCLCEWLVNDWNKRCLKTGGAAACMHALSAQTVFEKIKENKILETVK